MELAIDLERIYARSKAADKELTELDKATGTGQLDLHASAPPARLACSTRLATSPGFGDGCLTFSAES
jgi:hypothetical protein